MRKRHCGGNGLVRRIFPRNYFHQRHPVDRIEEVHPDKAFRMLQYRGHLADRQCGGVRADHCLIRNVFFHFHQDGLLRGHLFHDRLNHDVSIGEAGIVERAGDAMHMECHFTGLDLAQLYQLPVIVGRFGKSLADRIPRNILNPHRTAVSTEQPGNPTAHHAGAEHGGAVDGTRRHIGTGATVFLKQLVRMEETDQIAANRGGSQFGKGARFLLQSVGKFTITRDLYQRQNRRNGRVVPLALKHGLRSGLVDHDGADRPNTVLHMPASFPANQLPPFSF